MLTQADACSRCVTTSDERGPQTDIKGLQRLLDHCDRPILCKASLEIRVRNTAVALVRKKVRGEVFWSMGCHSVPVSFQGDDFFFGHGRRLVLATRQV